MNYIFKIVVIIQFLSINNFFAQETSIVLKIKDSVVIKKEDLSSDYFLKIKGTIKNESRFHYAFNPSGVMLFNKNIPFNNKPFFMSFNKYVFFREVYIPSSQDVEKKSSLYFVILDSSKQEVVFSKPFFEVLNMNRKNKKTKKISHYQIRDPYSQERAICDKIYTVKSDSKDKFNLSLFIGDELPKGIYYITYYLDVYHNFTCYGFLKKGTVLFNGSVSSNTMKLIIQ